MTTGNDNPTIASCFSRRQASGKTTGARWGSFLNETGSEKETTQMWEKNTGGSRLSCQMVGEEWSRQSSTTYLLERLNQSIHTPRGARENRNSVFYSGQIRRSLVLRRTWRKGRGWTAADVTRSMYVQDLIKSDEDKLNHKENVGNEAVK